MKENRRALFDALDALPWDQVPVAHTATDKGHGRITTRTIQVLPAPDDLPFPHVSQVFLIERYVTGLRGEPISAIAALGVASPELSRRAPPTWPATSASNGRSSPCTGSATPSIKRTNPRSGPETDQESWPLCATSRSAPSGWPDARTSLKPPDGPDAPWIGPLPSSASHHDLGTAVNPEVPAVGQAFQRLLSAVAHTRAHGLERINDPALLADPDSGETLGIHPIEPRLLAVELVAGPACAVNMTTGLRWFSGYDWDSLRAPIREMLGTWSRIGHMPGLLE